MSNDPAQPLEAMPLRGAAFRVCSLEDATLERSAASSRTSPGRFNTSGVGAVYLAREPDTAVDEVRRTAEREGNALSDAHPCTMLVVDLSLHRVVDLTRAGALEKWGLTPGDLTSDDMRQCQKVSREIVRRGAEGVRWPSATGGGQSIAVYLDHLSPESRIVIREAHALTCDALRAIERGATVAQLLEPIARIPLVE